jgi:SAM-dependent methyltransferase
VVADWVLEHVADPGVFAAEILRVLKPGEWLCASTVNRWGYVGIGARLIPNRRHKSFLRDLWPGRFEVDVFPTCYKLNTLSNIQKYFPIQHWDNFLSNTTPKYFADSKILFYFIDIYRKLVPYSLRADLLVFLKGKRQLAP